MAMNERFLVRNGILLDDEQDRNTLLRLLEQDKERRMSDRRERRLSGDEASVDDELAAELRRHRDRVLRVFRKRDLDVSVDELGLPLRAYNILCRNNVRTVGELVSRSRREIRNLRNMGEKGYADLECCLADFAVRQLADEW